MRSYWGRFISKFHGLLIDCVTRSFQVSSTEIDDHSVHRHKSNIGMYIENVLNMLGWSECGLIVLKTKNLHKAGSLWVSATSWEVVKRNYVGVMGRRVQDGLLKLTGDGGLPCFKRFAGADAGMPAMSGLAAVRHLPAS